MAMMTTANTSSTVEVAMRQFMGSTYGDDRAG
jgi:hypothetical protein